MTLSSEFDFNLALHSMANTQSCHQLVVAKIADLCTKTGDWSLVKPTQKPDCFGPYRCPDLVVCFKEANPLAIAEVVMSLNVIDQDTLLRWKIYISIVPITFYIFVLRGYEDCIKHILRTQDIPAMVCSFGFDEQLGIVIDNL